MNRPHIRFDGKTLEEIDEKWAHAQNDALGYFLWLYCILVNHKIAVPKKDDQEMLSLFVLYFEKICYWKDEDSGHWEEVRKISASSIGVVVAALKQLKETLNPTDMLSLRTDSKVITKNFLDILIGCGSNRTS